MIEPEMVIAYLQHIGLAARVLLPIPTGEMLEFFSHYDTVMPIFDPTGRMKTHATASKNERVVRALAAFQKVLLEEYPELGSEALNANT